MTDELDPGLRRLFASTAESPADEAFIVGVTAKTSRERRLLLLGRALAGGLLLAVIVAAAGTGLVAALNQGVGAVTVLVITSPTGWAAGLALALAVVVCVRTLKPLAVWGRPWSRPCGRNQGATL